MKDWFRERFHGLYWRQMAVTVGMVFLTLVLLGVSFFSLSYSYARGQKTDELMVRAMAVSKLSVRYLETGRYLSMEELQKDEQFRQLAATAAVISEMDILVCDMDGHVLLSTDATMEGRPVTIPSSVMDKVSADGTWAGRSRLDQIYASKQFVGGVSVVNPTTGEVLGAVFTVCASDSVDNLWRAFAGLLLMTAFVVLMISFMASSITTMRQIKPIREMARATRQYAEGDFDIRMNDYGRDDELGELAASFNNMAENLQQTERQRMRSIGVAIVERQGAYPRRCQRSRDRRPHAAAAEHPRPGPLRLKAFTPDTEHETIAIEHIAAQSAVGLAANGVAGAGNGRRGAEAMLQSAGGNLVRHRDQRTDNIGQRKQRRNHRRQRLRLHARGHHFDIHLLSVEPRVVDHRRLKTTGRITQMRDQLRITTNYHPLLLYCDSSMRLTSPRINRYATTPSSAAPPI